MKILGIAGLVIAVYFAYEGIRFAHTVSVSKQLIERTTAYERTGSSANPSLLVIGDSTAVGVGAADPESSIAGRSAELLDAAYVENLGISGAQVKDLPREIQEAKRTFYDVIIVQIGANDITRFHPARKTAQELVSILKTLPESPKVIVMSAGDVGTATAIPIVFRPFYTKLTLAYHAAFRSELTTAGYSYVNLYNAPRARLFKEQPGIYLAADGFHPSTAGYDIWFEAVRPYLISKN